MGEMMWLRLAAQGGETWKAPGTGRAPTLTVQHTGTYTQMQCSHHLLGPENQPLIPVLSQ